MQRARTATNEIEINKNTFSRSVDCGMAHDTYMGLFFCTHSTGGWCVIIIQAENLVVGERRRQEQLEVRQFTIPFMLRYRWRVAR